MFKITSAYAKKKICETLNLTMSAIRQFWLTRLNMVNINEYTCQDNE